MTAEPLPTTADPSPLAGGPIALPHGLPGFPGPMQCRLEALEGPAHGFLVLRAMAAGGPAFVVMPEVAARPQLAAPDRAAACRALGIAPVNSAVLFVVTLVARDDGVEVQANLRAPILLDTRRREAAQHVLASSAYPTRHLVHAHGGDGAMVPTGSVGTRH